jgi:hypothetical protein
MASKAALTCWWCCFAALKIFCAVRFSERLFCDCSPDEEGEDLEGAWLARRGCSATRNIAEAIVVCVWEVGVTCK